VRLGVLSAHVVLSLKFYYVASYVLSAKSSDCVMLRSVEIILHNQ
jgi:hypothetical protein